METGTREERSPTSVPYLVRRGIENVVLLHLAPVMAQSQ